MARTRKAKTQESAGRSASTKRSMTAGASASKRAPASKLQAKSKTAKTPTTAQAESRAKAKTKPKATTKASSRSGTKTGASKRVAPPARRANSEQRAKAKVAKPTSTPHSAASPATQPEELEKMTVRSLRELARQYLHEKTGQLKTKDALVRALQRVMPRRLTSEGRTTPKGGEKKSGLKGELSALASRAKQVVGDALIEGVPQTVSKVRRKLTTRGKQQASTPASRGSARRKSAEAPPRAPEEGAVWLEPAPAEPLVEGFFVARVAGEGEARRHHLTEDQASAQPSSGAVVTYDEQLGELPSEYGDNASVLLARDPSTLFYFWDVSAQARDAAAASLQDPKAVLRVYEGDRLVRELDFAFESKSYYLHGLLPGRAYRVETYFVGRDGRAALVGRPSNTMSLPNVGPSGDTRVWYLRIPWDVPLSSLRRLLRDSVYRLREAFASQYLGVERFSLPHSATWADERTRVLRVGGWTPPRSGRPF